jgi:hypothetical protein
VGTTAASIPGDEGAGERGCNERDGGKEEKGEAPINQQSGNPHVVSEFEMTGHQQARGHSLRTPTTFHPILTLFYSMKFSLSQLFYSIFRHSLKMPFFFCSHPHQASHGAPPPEKLKMGAHIDLS